MEVGPPPAQVGLLGHRETVVGAEGEEFKYHTLTTSSWRMQGNQNERNELCIVSRSPIQGFDFSPHNLIAYKEIIHVMLVPLRQLDKN